jgi:protein-glutamine gamma-glutamyltransferase
LLYKSGAEFAIFQKTKCNEQYWRLTKKGAFELKKSVLPHTAIEDIFLNGRKHAFECATAMVITFYKVALESIGKEQFNQLFSNLYLYDWQYDQDLGLDVHPGTDFLPGDCVYFKNLDYNPKTPEWQGENAIVLEGGLYYGHGIGMTDEQGMIEILNTKRKKYPDKSAFLEQRITRPDFNYLSHFASKIARGNSMKSCVRCFPNLIVCQIGSKTYFA